MNFLKNNWLSLLILAVMIGTSIYYYPQLPAQIPSKFDMNGNPTSYSSKEFVAIFPIAIIIFTYFFSFALVYAAPEKFAASSSRRSFSQILAAVGMLLLGQHLSLLMTVQSPQTSSYFMTWGIALFMVVFGNACSKIERNFVAGVRVPWVLASERNWRATHRLTGRLYVVSGLLLALLALVGVSIMMISITCLVIPAAAGVAYSYLYFTRNEKHQEKISPHNV